MGDKTAATTGRHSRGGVWRGSQHRAAGIHDNPVACVEVTIPAYLLGLCDSVGELRRFTLTALKDGRYRDAEAHLSSMDRIYEVVSQYHYPKAIVPVKVKQDQIRGIIERTRGDVAMAVAGHRAAERMETAGKD